MTVGANAVIESIMTQCLLNAFVLASIYFLIASGLALIFSIMGVVNFAHGEFCAIGAYGVWFIMDSSGVNYFAAIPVALVLTAIVGILAEKTIFAPLLDKPLNGLIASSGLLLILTSGMQQIFGGMDKQVSTPFAGKIVALGFGTIPIERVAIFIGGIIVAAFLLVFLRMTRQGLALQAVAQNRAAAALQGIKPKRMITLSFIIGSCLAGIAGALVSPIGTISPFMGGWLVLKAFIIITIGGLGSIAGALLASLILGFLDSFGAFFLGGPFSTILGFSLLVVFMALKPMGLFGHE